MYSSKYLELLIEELTRLPSIGQKSAQRLALHLLRAPREEALRLAEAIPPRTLDYYAFCGTPDQVVEQFAEFHEQGLRHPIPARSTLQDGDAFGIVARTLCHRRFDDSRCDRIYADPVGGKFASESLSEQLHRSLRGRVA